MSEAFEGSRSISKVIGGIKIFQYPNHIRPFEILSIMNYSSDVKDNIYKFLWFIKKSYKNINTNYIQNKWIKDIKQTHVKEFQNVKKTIKT